MARAVRPGIMPIPPTTSVWHVIQRVQRAALPVPLDVPHVLEVVIIQVVCVGLHAQDPHLV